MEELFFHVIEWIALWIGVIGILVILSGAIKGAWEYLTKPATHFPHIRLILSSHLVLGLEFLVGKDVIDTMLLGVTGKPFYEDLLSLITIVAIRIVLGHVLEKELKELRKNPIANHVPDEPKKKKRK